MLRKSRLQLFWEKGREGEKSWSSFRSWAGERRSRLLSQAMREKERGRVVVRAPAGAREGGGERGTVLSLHPE